MHYKRGHERLVAVFFFLLNPEKILAQIRLVVFEKNAKTA